MWQVEVIGNRVKGGTRKDQSQKVFYAKAADVSYGKTLEDRRRRAAKIGFEVDESLSNDDVSVLFNPKTKESIISIAGTRLSQPRNRWRDLFEDVLITAGLQPLSTRRKQVKSIVDEAQQKYNNYEKTITGHSLGANIAKDIAKKTGIDAVLYNVGSSPLSILSDKVSSIINKTYKPDVLKHYNVKSDPLSLSERLFGDSELVDIEHKKSDKSAHSLAQFTGEGKKQKKKTLKIAWLDHVNQVRKKNPGVLYKEILKMASMSYKK